MWEVISRTSYSNTTTCAVTTVSFYFCLNYSSFNFLLIKIYKFLVMMRENALVNPRFLLVRDERGAENRGVKRAADTLAEAGPSRKYFKVINSNNLGIIL